MCSCSPFECTCTHIHVNQYHSAYIEKHQQHQEVTRRTNHFTPQIYDPSTTWSRPIDHGNSQVHSNKQSCEYQNNRSYYNDEPNLLSDMFTSGSTPSRALSETTFQNSAFCAKTTSVNVLHRCGTRNFPELMYPTTACDNSDGKRDWRLYKTQENQRMSEIKDTYGFFNDQYEKQNFSYDHVRVKSEIAEEMVSNSLIEARQMFVKDNNIGLPTIVGTSINESNPTKICDDFSGMTAMDTGSPIQHYNDIPESEQYRGMAARFSNDFSPHHSSSGNLCHLTSQATPEYVELKPMKRDSEKIRRSIENLHSSLPKSDNCKQQVNSYQSPFGDFQNTSDVPLPTSVHQRSLQNRHDVTPGTQGTRMHTGDNHCHYHPDMQYACSLPSCAQMHPQLCNHSINITLTYN